VEVVDLKRRIPSKGAGEKMGRKGGAPLLRARLGKSGAKEKEGTKVERSARRKIAEDAERGTASKKGRERARRTTLKTHQT